MLNKLNTVTQQLHQNKKAYNNGCTTLYVLACRQYLLEGACHYEYYSMPL